MKILKFSAEWCNPCKALKKVLTEAQLPVEIEEIDIDQKPDESAKYRIRGVPTMVVLDDKQNELGRIVGLLSADEIKKKINEIAVYN
jgi:thioredoxin 1